MDDEGMVRLEGSRTLHRLAGFVAGGRRLVVITGAGCSTESGIPDYRDRAGDWKRRPPMSLREFLGSDDARRRYWARSFCGWVRLRDARPNRAHRVLARLEAMGRMSALITQNVDGLHQRAGSRCVIDLHGRADRVECLDCGGLLERETWQCELAASNPHWGSGPGAVMAPDGDADPMVRNLSGFCVPGCPGCGGVLKPAVVFFGEAVPSWRTGAALAALATADRVVVVGSSLMVGSGYRLVRAAGKRGVPVAAVNLGRTRADGELALKLSARAGDALPALIRLLVCRRSP